MALKFTADEALGAVKDCQSLDSAIAYLQQDCELCAGKYAMANVIIIKKEFYDEIIKRFLLDRFYVKMHT